MFEELVADSLEKQIAIAIANVGISAISFDIVHFFYLHFSHLIFPLFSPERHACRTRINVRTVWCPLRGYRTASKYKRMQFCSGGMMASAV